MILDSFDHAEEDFAKRLLIEARNEADTILAAVDRAPSNPAWNLLSTDEQTAIATAKDHLLAVRHEQDPRIIRDATLALDKATTRFAELLMDAAVSTAIRGKTMGEAGEEHGSKPSPLLIRWQRRNSNERLPSNSYPEMKDVVK